MAFSRRTALSFTQLSQMPTATAAGIAAQIAASRAEYNHAGSRWPTSFICYYSASAAGPPVRFDAPREARSERTVGSRRRNIDARFGNRYTDFPPVQDAAR